MKGNYGEITKRILVAVGLTGVVLTSAVAPGAVLVLKLLKVDDEEMWFPKKGDKQKAARAIQRLQKNELIRVKERNGKLVIELTRRGKKKFKDVQLENLHISKPPKWDGRWRIVIFDIPDRSFKHGRETLRAKLKQWEFYPLQKSVWVCPWPCENEIRVITELYGIAPYINIVVAEKIYDDKRARKHFAL